MQLRRFWQLQVQKVQAQRLGRGREGGGGGGGGGGAVCGLREQLDGGVFPA